MKLSSILVFLGVVVGSHDPFDFDTDTNTVQETFFVYEMARHGARSPNMIPSVMPDGFFGKDVKKGELTDIGRVQQINNGLDRRREYVKLKKLLSETYNPKEIIVFSTSKQRCVESGHSFLNGLYPFQDTQQRRDKAPFDKKPQIGKNSPMLGNNYEKMLDSMHNWKNSDKQPYCEAKAVIKVPAGDDMMMRTENCRKLHDFLNKDKFDMPRLEREMTEYFGIAEIEKTKKELEEHFKVKSKNLRTYFEMLDTRVSELKQSGGGADMARYQRQECYILANNFIGDDKTPGNVYLSRMLVPMFEVLKSRYNAQLFFNKGQTFAHSKLKYMLYNNHDTNISNLLRFLGYWEKNGYDKHVKFASSVRFELFKNAGFRLLEDWYPDNYHVRIVYDDKEITLDTCKEWYCTWPEFEQYFTENLNFDLAGGDYCES